MNPKKLAVIAAVLLATSATAGCFGPDEGPVTTVEDTEEVETADAGEETVEAGAAPQGEPQAGPENDTAIAAGGTTTEPGEDEGEDGTEGVDAETEADDDIETDENATETGGE